MSDADIPRQPPDPLYAARLLAARARAERHGGALESATAESTINEAAGGAPHADDVLQRVHDTMSRIPEDEIIDRDEYERALAIFLQQADKTLRKVGGKSSAPFDNQDRITLEAVIRTDGTRPSLLVRGSQVDAEHPLAGGWKDDLIATREIVRARAKAIGRIQPAGGSPSNFYGTGWLVKKINDAAGLVLTNNHVLDAMKSRLPAGSLTEANGKYTVKGGAAVIDFAAESGSVDARRFNIIEATPTPIPGPYFEYFDAAVMKIARIDSESPELADPIPVVADIDGPQGAFSSFCLIGYPAQPEIQSGIHNGVDWTWVTNTLFGGRFGVKRLAPATAHRPLGTITADAKQWVFGHDATTLGGNSGSPVIAWKNGGFGFGLHFAGTDTASNYAHAIAKCIEQFSIMGIEPTIPT